jgi:hypothetical protein
MVSITTGLITGPDPQGQQLSEDIHALERGCLKGGSGSRNQGRLALGEGQIAVGGAVHDATEGVEPRAVAYAPF